MRRALLLLSATVCALGCQGTSVIVLTSPPEAGAGNACTPEGVASGDAGPKGPHGGVWTTYAHDMQRTSHADGPAGAVQSPEVAWTMRLGGFLDDQQAAVGDLDGDGRAETVTVSGGRATATDGTGATLWQGPLEGVQYLLGIWDLNGDGKPEVGVHVPTGVEILDGQDGHPIALLGESLPAQASFVAEPPQGGLLVVGTGQGLAAYDFRGGLQVSTPLWTASTETPIDVAIGDVDGDGAPDVVQPLSAGFRVLDPLTGNVEYSDDPIGPAAYAYLYELVQADSTPGLEILAVDTSYQYSPQTGIYMLGVRNGALVTLWSSAQTPTLALGADNYATSGAVVDLEGNGGKEIVYSQWDGASQQWTTQIADAAAGTPLGSIPGALVQALADVDGDGKPEVVVRSGPILANQTPPRSTLRVYDFDSATSGPVPKAWTLPNAHVVDLSPSVRANPDQLARPVAADFEGASAGVELLVGQDTTGRKADTILAVLHGDGTLGAQYAIPTGVDASVLWTGNGMTAAGSQSDVLTFSDDGVVHALTSALAPSAEFGAGSYANWLGVYPLDTSRTITAAATSNRDLLWIDGTHLHADGTPYQPFHLPGVVDSSSAAATGVPLDPMTYLAAQSPTLVAYQQGETAVTMVGLDTAGVESFTTALADGSIVASPGPYAQDMNGDGTADLIVPVININSLESLAVFSGTTGLVIGSTPLATMYPSADQTTTGSLVDVNGDGVLDLITPLHDKGDVAINLAASPMSSIWTIPYEATTPRLNGTIAAAPVDGSGPSLLRFNGNSGAGQYARYSKAGAVVVSVDEGTLSAQGGDVNAAALVHRTPGASTFDMVSAGMAGDALSRVRRIAGDTLATVWDVYAAGGNVAPAAPGTAYALHDPVAVDLHGDGRDEIVFGSDDGFLYAVHAEDGSLDFALDLGAPVDHVVAADVDLDPQIELLAALGDGRLVAVDGAGQYSALRDSGDGGVTCTSEAGGDYEPTHASCACEVRGRRTQGPAPLLAVVATLLGLVRLRRRSN